MKRTRVLVPDTPWSISAVWGDLPVDLVFYDPTDTTPVRDDRAEVFLDGSGPRDQAEALADALPNLKMLQTLSAGTEHWDNRVKTDVTLVNCSGAHGGPTAEMGIAGLLALYRRLPETFRSNDAQTWAPQMGETAVGKSALVIGAGDVGQSLALRLRALGVDVTIVGRSARDGVVALAEAWTRLGDVDMVCLAAPLTDDTRHLMNAEKLGRMKDGAVVLNIGRGPIVDTDALLAELQAERLRAVLDVTDPEPLPADHPLWTAPGLVLTPHTGGMVTTAFDAAMRVAIEQIGQFALGQTPTNAVRRA